MLPPDRVLKSLRESGLPAGPLTEPLRYYATTHGKLHRHRGCAPASARPRLVEQDLMADDVTHERLCTSCRDQLPRPAQDHVEWCRAIQRALLVLASVGVKSPLSTRHDTAADKFVADGRTPTWRQLAKLDKAAIGLTGVDNVNRATPVPELAGPLAQVAALVTQTRVRLAADMPTEGWLRPGQPRRIVALTNYCPQMRLGETLSSDEILARCTVVSHLPHRWAYVLAPAGATPRLGHSVDLGAVEPADDPAVLATALRLFLDRVRGDVVGVPDELFTQALTSARLIHAPAA